MGKDTEGMSTLKEMNYRLQEMPDGCWNCRFSTIDGTACRKQGMSEDPPHFERIRFNGICSRYEKEAV
jgi:hypothetical protein